MLVGAGGDENKKRGACDVCCARNVIRVSVSELHSVAGELEREVSTSLSQEKTRCARATFFDCYR